MKKRRLLMAALAVILLICAVQVARKLYDGSVRTQVYQQAASLAGLPEDRTAAAAPPAVQPEAGEAPQPEEVRILGGLDLAALREVNPETAGWIEIPGTELSYPVLQGEDNQYYLSHTWSGESNSGGAVFLECTNSRDFSDYHTIVYGHRMRDGSMFGSLRGYSRPDYWQEHPSVYVVLDGWAARYDIFAAYETPVRSIVYRLDIESSGLEEELVNYALEHSVIDTGAVPEAGERILTLSTCTGLGHANRWIVQAVLREEWPLE